MKSIKLSSILRQARNGEHYQAHADILNAISEAFVSGQGIKALRDATLNFTNSKTSVTSAIRRTRIRRKSPRPTNFGMSCFSLFHRRLRLTS